MVRLAGLAGGAGSVGVGLARRAREDGGRGEVVVGRGVLGVLESERTVRRAKPSTAIRYVVPAAALKLTLDCRVPLKSSFEAIDASVPKLLPVNTPSVVSKAASRRLKLVGPLSGAVQEYQTVVSAALPAIDRLAGLTGRVGVAAEHGAVGAADPGPGEVVVAGRPTSPLTKVRRAPW